MNEKFQQMLDLDQKIAEARARVEMEKSLPERGMLSPGIFDYITEGKSDLYKGYYDAVRAREMQDAQMANQRQMQERQLENALRLAQESRAAQQDKINSDNEKTYQRAKNKLEFAKAMKEKAVAEGDRVGILNAEYALNEATLDYNDALKLTGRQQEPVIEESQKESQEDSQDQKDDPEKVGVRIEKYKGIKSFKTEKEKNDTLREIKNDPMFKQNEQLMAQYNRLSGIRSGEAGAKVISDLQKILDNGGNPDPSKLKAEGLIIDIKTDKKTGKKTRKVIKDPKTK